MGVLQPAHQVRLLLKAAQIDAGAVGVGHQVVVQHLDPDLHVAPHAPVHLRPREVSEGNGPWRVMGGAGRGETRQCRPHSPTHTARTTPKPPAAMGVSSSSNSSTGISICDRVCSSTRVTSSSAAGVTAAPAPDSLAPASSGDASAAPASRSPLSALVLAAKGWVPVAPRRGGEGWRLRRPVPLSPPPRLDPLLHRMPCLHAMLGPATAARGQLGPLQWVGKCTRARTRHSTAQ